MSASSYGNCLNNNKLDQKQSSNHYRLENKWLLKCCLNSNSIFLIETYFSMMIKFYLNLYDYYSMHYFLKKCAKNKVVCY